MGLLTVIASELRERSAMRWLQGCAILFAFAFVLFAVPARLEGPVLVPISPGHGLALIDVVALVPLLGGLALLVGGLWQRRERLDAALTRRPWAARMGGLRRRAWAWSADCVGVRLLLVVGDRSWPAHGHATDRGRCSVWE